MAERKRTRSAAAKTDAPNWDWRQLFGFEKLFDRAHTLISSGTMPASVIFEGRNGLGKKSAVIGVVAHHFCVSGRACGECSPCRSLMQGEHPEVLVIDGSSELIKIEQIRQMQRHLDLQASGHGEEGSDSPRPARTVVIIDIDHMKIEAANCMLKVLEEPPTGAQIYCTSGSYARLLPTVRSRLVRWRVSPPDAGATVRWLQSGSEEAAKLSEANLLAHVERNALSPGLAKQNLSALIESSSKRWQDTIPSLWQSPSLEQLLKIASELSADKVPLAQLLSEMEMQLNGQYRQLVAGKGVLHSQLQWEALVRRRAILRRLKELVVNKSIQMNNQLSIESIGLVYRL
jgi:DNA polymerase III subunit delta'